MMGVLTGAEVLLHTLTSNGINTCFMNPGTSEMHFVAALDRIPEMRGILCLFEGVCSGAADGYARASGKAAATLLHLGPGLANGLANFHNARKARMPIVSIVGEHSIPHFQYDAPLSANIETFARTVSDRVRTAKNGHELGADMSATIADALQPPGQVAMLIVPADLSWSAAEGCGAVVPRAPAACRPVRPLKTQLNSFESRELRSCSAETHFHHKRWTLRRDSPPRPVSGSTSRGM